MPTLLFTSRKCCSLNNLRNSFNHYKSVYIFELWLCKKYVAQNNIKLTQNENTQVQQVYLLEGGGLKK